MCLTSEFFENRETALRRAASRGELELSAFLGRKHLGYGWLFAMGALRIKDVMSTADLDMTEVAGPGKPFLRTDRANQIIFVRRGQEAALVTALNAARRAAP